MYYLYLIQSLGGRAGFGVTQNPKERNKQYCSHSGDIVQFKFLYGGIRAHGKALENTIKRQYVGNIWMVDDWKTEWLKDNVSIESLKEYVEDLIKTRHFRLTLVHTDYDFRKDFI
jgi:hypothetical protein